MNFLYQGLISTIKFVNDYLKKNKEIDLEYFITLPLAYDIIRNLTPCKELWTKVIFLIFRFTPSDLSLRQRYK